METSKISKTLVVNFFGGPCSGKSTLSGLVFGKLKSNGKNCEFALEYAKDLVYEERNKTFDNQIYIFAKQHHKIFNLLGQTDIILCDSPLLVTPIYDVYKRKTLKDLALLEHNKCNNLNIFVNRKKEFNPKGRIHNFQESLDLDNRIEEFLADNHIRYIHADSSEYGADLVIKYIYE